MSFQIPKILDTLRQSLVAGFGHPGMEKALTSPRIALACQLFVDAHFEASHEARLLSLMGVLEVLKDQKASSEDAQSLVDKWIQESAQLDIVEAHSFRGTLQHLKSISISRGISSVVGRHLGPDRASEAKRLYSIRSTLVHDGKRPDDLGDAVRRAEGIARDLLISTLTTNRHLEDEET